MPEHVTIREVCPRDGLQIEDPIPADVARNAVGHDLPSAPLRAGDRILS